ncbi:sigma-54 dependent transcriptional regulator, partial [Caulobacter sp. 17J65-9]|uniref:sigma-54-dependent transcriptional regulator n=1 Tax=Caulobacter sp. 17J65-9 TaxID=2709382 RepID=UPI0013CD5E51
MRLLVVGRLSGQLAAAVKMAMSTGAKVSHVETGAQATDSLRRGQGAELLMVDYDLDIAGLIAANEAERIHVPVVACGVGADPRRAADAIRAGAKEFIPLPPDAELIAAVLAAVADDERPLVTSDPAMQQVLKLADQVAKSEASILITGESGVGKEVMARYVHAKSRRADKPFISVNCAAIPENLLESELFGHEKGAFTGAVARRIGKFEEADGGTLLLDEISEMDARLQAKLLRAIQERVIDRVGGQKPVKVDIRILATSNRDLAQAVKEGTFREDLLYRLNVVNLRLPALRERPADVVVLAEHFVKKYADANGVPQRPIASEAKRRLAAHPWPGNVRELENAMHRAVLLAVGDEIDADAIRLPDGQPLAAAGAPSSPGYAAQAAQAADAAA